MEQNAKVRAVHENGTAQVVVVRESACSGDCHKCSGCGAAKETLVFEAVNAIGAQPGEVVVIRSESGPVLTGAAVLYLVPMVTFFAGYLLGEQWDLGALMGCIGFILGFLPAVLYDRLVAGKKKTVYTITGYPAGNAARPQTKGDHCID